MSTLDKYTDEELFQILGSDVEKEIKSRGHEFGWHKKVQYAGDIYILVNPAFSNLIKIGYADNVQRRLKSLNSNSGLPDPYHVYATYKVKKRLEDLKLHTLIDFLDSDLRHAKNREFYEMSPEKAYAILSAIAEINGDEDLLVLNPLDDDFFKEDDIAEKAVEPIPKPTRKSNVIPDGDYYMSRKVKRWNNIIVDGAIPVTNGNIVVQEGSMVCPIEGVGITQNLHDIRENLTVVDNILKENVVVTSPSAAAGLLLGGAADGWQEWKTKDGQPLDIFRH